MNAGLLRRIGLSVAAPLVAAVIAILISSLVLELSGSDAIETFRTMIENGTKLESMIDTLNRATPLYLSLQGEPGIVTSSIPTNGFDLVRLRADRAEATVEAGHDREAKEADILKRLRAGESTLDIYGF